MRIASNIFTWVVGLLEGIAALIVTLYEVSKDDSWAFIILAIGLIFRLTIMIWRQIAVNDGGSTIAAGICTLIFVSIVGGILTILLNDYQKDNNPKTRVIERGYTQKQAHDMIEVNRNLLLKGIITEEEFNKRQIEISSKVIKSEVYAGA